MKNKSQPQWQHLYNISLSAFLFVLSDSWRLYILINIVVDKSIGPPIDLSYQLKCMKSNLMLKYLVVFFNVKNISLAYH